MLQEQNCEQALEHPVNSDNGKKSGSSDSKTENLDDATMLAMIECQDPTNDTNGMSSMPINFPFGEDFKLTFTKKSPPLVFEK